MNCGRDLKKRGLEKYKLVIICLVVCFLVVGFAALTRNFTINGTTNVAATKWDVHFENVKVTNGSVATTTENAAQIVGTKRDSVNFTLNLNKPGDFYEFTVDVVNDSTLDTMISKIESTPTLTADQLKYLEYKVEYKCGGPIEVKDFLGKKTRQTIYFRVNYRADIDASNLPTTDPEPITFSYKLTYEMEKNSVKKTSYTNTRCLIDSANDASVTTYTSGNTANMYTFNHAATAQTPALIDYRYLGGGESLDTKPNNYIDFNGETWRILGVFPSDNGTGIYENRIKIVKDTPISGTQKFNETLTNNSWIESNLKDYLNETYYNTLSTEAKNKIATVQYYLGGQSKSASITGEQFYSNERGLSGTNKSQYNVKWLGKVGIVSPSDWIYTYALGVGDKCFTDPYNCEQGSVNKNSYLWKTGYKTMLLMPNTNDNLKVFYVYTSGYVHYSGSITESYALRPVVYLNTDTVLKGTGTSEDHYTIVS